MLAVTYYFLQVILCSALMMGYYWLVLRNKRFHQYNRFYLLAITLLSWIVPLIKIQWNRPIAGDPNVMHFLSVVADNNSEMEETVNNKGFQWNWDAVAACIYFAVAGFLLFFIVKAFIRLYRLLKTHSCRHVEDVYLILTQAKGTPFSFFRYIFWNEEIDLRSESGKQILQHELAHVRQRHSIDKIFIQLLLVAGWFNPFFWLIRKEMDMIHEFIADKKAVHNGDTASLAQMLLTAAYPQQKFALTHPFFFSPIKRRLLMLTNNKDPRFTYVRRLVVLPLLAIVVMLFAFRNKEYRSHQPISVETVMENVVGSLVGNNDRAGANDDNDHGLTAQLVYKLDKTYTVVIDAGHGGKDAGAVSADGSSEKDITLALAQKIKALNNNDRVKIVLTRENDISQSVTDKANIANANRADLFISLHCNNNADRNANENTGLKRKQEGIELFIASKDKAKNYEANYRFANQMATTLQKVNQLNGIRSRQQGIWVLQAVNCPSLLIETGYITSKTDLERLKSNTYQQKMADAILVGIQLYLSADKSQTYSLTADTLIINKRDAAEKTSNLSGQAMGIGILQNKEEGAITSRSNTKKDTFQMRLSWKNMSTAPAPLLIQDGKKVDIEDWDKLDPNKISQVNIIKDLSAVEKYGEDAKNGVIEIITKKAMLSEGEINYSLVSKVQISKAEGEHEKVIVTAQTAPSFPGGAEGWNRYLAKNQNINLLVENGAPAGKYTVYVSFMVDSDGRISNIRAENDPGYGSMAEALRLIGKGPRWKPATQNGQRIASWYKEAVSFTIGSSSTATKETKTASLLKKLNELKTGNDKSYFIIDGQSVITTAQNQTVWLSGITDLVFVDGKKVSVEELNTKFKRSSFVLAAGDGYVKKYGKGVLMLSTRNLTVKQVGEMLGSV